MGGTAVLAKFPAPFAPRTLQAAPTSITFTVDSTMDQIDDDLADGICRTTSNTCTLRAAVMQSNINSAPDMTIVSAGKYDLSRPQLALTAPIAATMNLTTPTLGRPITTISGVGPDFTVIDAQQIDRVFRVHEIVMLRSLGWPSATVICPRNGNVSEAASITRESSH